MSITISYKDGGKQEGIWPTADLQSLCRTYGACILNFTLTQGFRPWAKLFRLLRRLH